MFSNVTARKAAKETPIVMQDVASRSSHNYASMVSQLKAKGAMSERDPRSHLDYARVRQLSVMGPDALMSRYQQAMERGFNSAQTLEERIRYRAAMKAANEFFDPRHRVESDEMARKTEQHAMSFSNLSAGNPVAKEMLEISAAFTERTQREKIMEGFHPEQNKGSIAQAAERQGISWMEARDNLVAFGVLETSDPRRKIRRADIEAIQKFSGTRSEAMPLKDAESQAMTRLARSPDDPQALGLLASVGARSERDAAKAVTKVAETIKDPNAQKRSPSPFRRRQQESQLEL